MDEPNRPTGTITFLFSDIEGSTELAEAVGALAYRELLELHQRLLREAFALHGGHPGRYSRGGGGRGGNQCLPVRAELA